MRSLAKPFSPGLLTSAPPRLRVRAEEWLCFPGRSPARTSSGIGHQNSDSLGLTARPSTAGSSPPAPPHAQGLAKAGLKPTPLHNTCNRQNTACWLCVHHGWPILITESGTPGARADLGRWPDGGVSQGADQVAIDGCGAPVFYVPLKNIALGYARWRGRRRSRWPAC